MKLIKDSCIVQVTSVVNYRPYTYRSRNVLSYPPKHSSPRITEETYFGTLLEEMERLLITLFVMDKAGEPLDENEMRAEYEKLLNAID